MDAPTEPIDESEAPLFRKEDKEGIEQILALATKVQNVTGVPPDATAVFNALLRLVFGKMLDY